MSSDTRPRRRSPDTSAVLAVRGPGLPMGSRSWQNASVRLPLGALEARAGRARAQRCLGGADGEWARLLLHDVPAGGTPRAGGWREHDYSGHSAAHPALDGLLGSCTIIVQLPLQLVAAYQCLALAAATHPRLGAGLSAGRHPRHRRRSRPPHDAHGGRSSRRSATEGRGADKANDASRPNA